MQLVGYIAISRGEKHNLLLIGYRLSSPASRSFATLIKLRLRTSDSFPWVHGQYFD